MADETVYSYLEKNQTVWSFLIGDVNYAMVADDGTSDDVILGNIDVIQDCMESALNVLDEYEQERSGNGDAPSLKDIADLVLNTIHSVTGISLEIIGAGPVIMQITDVDEEAESG